MDSSRDNPFLRFATFWWALATFLIFGVIVAIIWAFNTGTPGTLEDLAAKKRYKTKEEIFKAQAAALPKDALDAAIKTVGDKLAASKPTALQVPEQLVPNSPTSKKAAEDAPIDPAVMEVGKAQYMICGACHGPNGEGTMVGPPLAGSEWVKGPVENLIKIQMRGLAGPIMVAGKEYTFPAGMTAQSYQTDEQIAGALTYIRNSFGNKAPAVKPADVTPFRSEVGKPQLTPSELIKP